MRNPLGVDKKPLFKRHSKGTIRVEKTQGGWIQNRAAISKQGKPDLQNVALPRRTARKIPPGTLKLTTDL
jgi:hypothetical protein